MSFNTPEPMTQEEFLDGIREAIQDMADPNGDYQLMASEYSAVVDEVKRFDPVMATKLAAIVTSIQDFGSYVQYLRRVPRCQAGEGRGALMATRSGGASISDVGRLQEARADLERQLGIPVAASIGRDLRLRLLAYPKTDEQRAAVPAMHRGFPVETREAPRAA